MTSVLFVSWCWTRMWNGLSGLMPEAPALPSHLMA